MPFIYALIDSGLVLYVGKTIDIKERERQHRGGRDSSGSRDIPKYFDWVMIQLEECDIWTHRERFWYDKLNPLYNRCRPGTTAKQWIALKSRARETLESPPELLLGSGKFDQSCARVPRDSRGLF